MAFRSRPGVRTRVLRRQAIIAAPIRNHTRGSPGGVETSQGSGDRANGNIKKTLALDGRNLIEQDERAFITISYNTQRLARAPSEGRSGHSPITLATEERPRDEA